MAYHGTWSEGGLLFAIWKGKLLRTKDTELVGRQEWDKQGTSASLLSTISLFSGVQVEVQLVEFRRALRQPWGALTLSCDLGIPL